MTPCQLRDSAGNVVLKGFARWYELLQMRGLELRVSGLRGRLWLEVL